jgi:cardiolipin synthase
VSPAEPLRDAIAQAVTGHPEAREILERELAAGLVAEGPDRLARMLATELRRAAVSRDRVSLVATGLAWLGGGTRAIEQTLVELIETAERELALVVYAMSAGPVRVWDALARALDGGVRCSLVVDRLESQNPEMLELLRRLRNRHPATFDVVDFLGQDDRDHLHAKIAVADRSRALVGSANLTAHGLLLAHELAVLLEGPVADEIAARIDLLLRSRLVRRLP